MIEKNYQEKSMIGSICTAAFKLTLDSKAAYGYGGLLFC